MLPAAAPSTASALHAALAVLARGALLPATPLLGAVRALRMLAALATSLGVARLAAVRALRMPAA